VQSLDELLSKEEPHGTFHEATVSALTYDGLGGTATLTAAFCVGDPNASNETKRGRRRIGVLHLSRKCARLASRLGWSRGSGARRVAHIRGATCPSQRRHRCSYPPRVPRGAVDVVLLLLRLELVHLLGRASGEFPLASSSATCCLTSACSRRRLSSSERRIVRTLGSRRS